MLGFAMLGLGVWARVSGPSRSIARSLSQSFEDEHDPFQLEKDFWYAQLQRTGRMYLDPSIFLIIVGIVTFVIGSLSCRLLSCGSSNIVSEK